MCVREVGVIKPITRETEAVILNPTLANNNYKDTNKQVLRINNQLKFIQIVIKVVQNEGGLETQIGHEGNGGGQVGR